MSEASLLTLLPTCAGSIFSVLSAAHATEHRAWHMVHSQQVCAEWMNRWPQNTCSFYFQILDSQTKRPQFYLGILSLEETPLTPLNEREISLKSRHFLKLITRKGIIKTWGIWQSRTFCAFLKKNHSVPLWPTSGVFKLLHSLPQSNPNEVQYGASNEVCL